MKRNGGEARILGTIGRFRLDSMFKGKLAIKLEDSETHAFKVDKDGNPQL